MHVQLVVLGIQRRAVRWRWPLLTQISIVQCGEASMAAGTMHTSCTRSLTAACRRPDLGVYLFCREGADKLQYELSLYLAIQQSVECLRAAEAQVAEVAATAAADAGKPRGGRALRKAGAALAPKAAAGTGPIAAEQQSQAGPCQAHATSNCNSINKAARQSKHALATSEAAACTKHAQAAAEDTGLVAGGGIALGQAAYAAAQAAAGAAAEAAEAAEAAAKVPAAGSRRRGRPPKRLPQEAHPKRPATAVPAQPTVLCQEASGPSLLGKRAAEGGRPDSSPRVKQPRRDSPVVDAEDGGGPARVLGGAEGRTPLGAEATAEGAGPLGGAEGRTPFSAEATAEGAGAAGLPAAEPAAGVQRTQRQKRSSPAVEPGAEGAPAQLLAGAEEWAQPGAADAAEDAGAVRIGQTGGAAAADKAGSSALHADERAAAGGGDKGAPAGGSVGPGDNLAAADVMYGRRGPATEAAAQPAASATLGLVPATAAHVPDAGWQGAWPAGLGAASGCGPPLPTSEAGGATAKADDVGTLAGPAAAALRTAVSCSNSLGACSEGPRGGRSPLAAVSPRSDWPMAPPKSRLAQTAGWRSLFSSRWTS